MRIGILGSGPVGRGLAELLGRAGHQVTLGTGHPDAPTLRHLTPQVRVGAFADAAGCETVVLAVRHGAARGIVSPLLPLLADKVVIDAMNAWIANDYEAAGLTPSTTEGFWAARLLPTSHVARAFSHIDWDLLVPAATAAPHTWGAAYAADDDQTSDAVAQLILDTGYVPVRVGRLAESAILDVDGALFSRMLLAEDMRRAVP